MAEAVRSIAGEGVGTLLVGKDKEVFLPFTIQHYNYSNIDSPGCLHGSAGTGGE